MAEQASRSRLRVMGGASEQPRLSTKERRQIVAALYEMARATYCSDPRLLAFGLCLDTCPTRVPSEDLFADVIYFPERADRRVRGIWVYGGIAKHLSSRELGMVSAPDLPDLLAELVLPHDMARNCTIADVGDVQLHAPVHFLEACVMRKKTSGIMRIGLG